MYSKKQTLLNEKKNVNIIAVYRKKMISELPYNGLIIDHFEVDP